MRIKPLVFEARAISNCSKKTNVNSDAIHVGGGLTGAWSPLCHVLEKVREKRGFELCVPDGPGVYRLIAIDASHPVMLPIRSTGFAALIRAGPCTLGQLARFNAVLVPWSRRIIRILGATGTVG